MKTCIELKWPSEHNMCRWQYKSNASHANLNLTIINALKPKYHRTQIMFSICLSDFVDLSCVASNNRMLNMRTIFGHTEAHQFWIEQPSEWLS